MKKTTVIAFALLLVCPRTGSPQVGTAFTYQGRLTDSAAPANGAYDLEMQLYDAVTLGVQVGSTVTLEDVSVVDGLFTVSLDFGAAFTGSKRWLQIGVRPGASAGAFTALTPRQELTPAPNAVFSASAATAASAAGFSGALGGEVTGTQGATTVSNAVPTNTTGAIVRRDGSGDFSARSVGLSGNLTLVSPSTASTGLIMKGPNRFIHDSGPGGNTFVGESAGTFTIAGNNNVGVGRGTLGSDTTGSSNTAVGDLSLNLNTTGSANTAVGRLSLFSNTAGGFNTALGTGALQNNTTGGSNSASGRNALFANTVGSGNTATGATALTSNVSGVGNTANGQSALSSNTGGNSNTAAGQLALFANTSGSFNTAVGLSALSSNTTAGNNTALGVSALQNNTLGASNIAVGSNAGFNLTTGSFNISIGNDGVAAEANTIRLGAAANHSRAFVAGIRGVTTGVADAIPVVIDSQGQLGTAPLPIPANFSGSLLGEVTGTQGATVVSNAVAANTASAIVRRDASGDFSNRSTTLLGNLTLANPSTSTAGNILKGANRFIHNFGTSNTFIGENAGNLNPALTGASNTAIGFQALTSNTTGNGNTAAGVNALFFNTDGVDNTATGRQALQNNTNGSNNTATGVSALFSNTTGGGNTASGERALLTNSTGSNNTAVGRSALRLNTNGFLNTATGASALQANTTGTSNTAMGAAALQNSTANNNTATGQAALFANTTGGSNTAAGFNALGANTTGSNNIALGSSAGSNLTTGSNNIAIGHFAVAAETNTIRIGLQGTQTSTIIAGISGVTVGGGGVAAVVIDDTGRLGTGPAQTPANFSGSLVGEVTGTQGATVVTNAVSTNTASAIVRRDGSGSFAAGSTTLSGNFNLAASTATAGNITKGGNRFLHAFGTGNTFLGTDAGNLSASLTGNSNVGLGVSALTSNTTGSLNTAAGANALQANTTGTSNTAVGTTALFENTSGGSNTATGTGAMHDNTTGSSNTASGFNALFSNSTGGNNTATGAGALALNSTGGNNTATGTLALQNNTVGSNNVAAGSNALLANTTAGQNTAVGVEALRLQSFSNGGSDWDSGNTAVGYQALRANQPTNTTTGRQNTALGFQALFSNTSGRLNVAVGSNALSTNLTGDGNTAIGNAANVTAANFTNATAIGNQAMVNASNKIRLGNASVNVIEGQVAYTFPSDKTKKENFRDVDAQAVLQKLRAMDVTTWNYIGHDPKEFRHYGPMAQDFYAAFGRDEVGAIGTETTINSGDITAIVMLGLKGLDAQTQRDQRTISSQLALLEGQTARIAELERQVDDLNSLKQQLAQVTQTLKALTDKMPQ